MDNKASSKEHNRNPKFYWEPVIFLVEDQFFKVTRHMLDKASKTFLTMVLPQGDAAAVAGVDDERPVVIKGVRSADFENLLDSIVHAEQKEVPKFNKDEWLAVLKLATMWGMVDIRSMAINEITKSKSLSDVDQVILGREHAVADWMISGYRALTKRKTVVSRHNASRLTLSTCLKVWQAQVSISDAFGLDKVERDTLDYMFASELDEVYQRGLVFGDRARPSKPRFPASPTIPTPQPSSAFSGSSNSAMEAFFSKPLSKPSGWPQR
ncbi:hypothetical protein IW261DRAFT_791388 [Armillaria novae-zelandiae]|uniref:BTB domain-containing protein n=1 Tax=Armillaria novae-zelandiae TaxID=153914 RepID=A0AA39PMC9_9AGAR|nr:hypothetical protein IW261DRAFT_791388 [Armillaria novae-zelandiae]